MPISCVFDAEHQVLLSRSSGTITLRDILAHITYREEHKLLNCPELLDATDSRTALKADDMRVSAERIAELLRVSPVGPVAIVTTDDVGYGMARMFSLLCESRGVSVEVFRQVEPARNWLAIFQAVAH